jgi:hypothetical protein
MSSYGQFCPVAKDTPKTATYFANSASYIETGQRAPVVIHLLQYAVG